MLSVVKCRLTEKLEVQIPRRAGHSSSDYEALFLNHIYKDYAWGKKRFSLNIGKYELDP